jgi:hypothetical protein
MAGTWTKAAQLRREFKAGRPRLTDLVLTPTTAILEACISLNGLQTAMKAAGLSEDDVQGVLVLMTPNFPEGRDQTHLYAIPDISGLPALYKKVMALMEAAEVIPLGVLFKQIDRDAANPKDAKSGAFVWAQPWRVGLRESRALLASRDRYANLEPGGECRFVN